VYAEVEAWPGRDGDPRMIYVVKNRDTGIIVSRWATLAEAQADMAARDAKWSHVQAAEDSPLVVDMAQPGADRA
jgi:hypothetical protein